MSTDRVTWPRVVRSEALKLRTLRSTFWCSVIMIVLAVGFGVLQSAGFAALESSSRLAEIRGFDRDSALLVCATSGTLLVGLVAAVLGVLVISGEFGSGMIRSTFAAVPRRTGALTAKALVVALLTLVVTFAGVVLAAVVAASILSAAGLPADLGAAKLWAGLVGAAVSVAFLTIVAFGLGALLKNTAAGIATALGVILVLPIVLGAIAGAASIDWLENVATVLPSNAGAELHAYGAFGDPVSTTHGLLTLNAWAGGAISLGWAAILLVLGILAVRRRDV